MCLDFINYSAVLLDVFSLKMSLLSYRIPFPLRDFFFFFLSFLFLLSFPFFLAVFFFFSFFIHRTLACPISFFFLLFVFVFLLLYSMTYLPLSNRSFPPFLNPLYHSSSLYVTTLPSSPSSLSHSLTFPLYSPFIITSYPDHLRSYSF